MLRKLVLSAVWFSAAMTPVWIYLVARFLLSPEGFWQNLLLFGVGVYILGWLQLILSVALVLVLVVIWFDSN